ncbi:MAG TPA: hypothetical protein PKV72_04610 [Candidatus Peribacteria bacterium]|nr:hypothetical protein [Candidatus Peribacteria bacterium]
MKFTSSLVAAGIVFAAAVPSVLAADTTANITTGGAGELTIGVSDSQLTGSVPQGASRVHLLTLNLSASCDADVMVSQIDVHHIGIGAVSDIKALYLVDNNSRLSRSVAFDRSGNATLRLRSFMVKKCGAARLQLLGDFSRDAGVASEHGVELRQSAGVVSTAKQVIVEQDTSDMTFGTSPSNGGELTVKFLSVSPRVRYGRTETVARIQLSADAKSGHILRSITLTNDESARDMDLINLTLQTSAGKTLTPVAQRMKAKKVTLQFEPSFVINSSQTVVLLLKAQINGSVTRKINFMLEEESDLDASPYRSRN